MPNRELPSDYADTYQDYFVTTLMGGTLSEAGEEWDRTVLTRERLNKGRDWDIGAGNLLTGDETGLLGPR